MAAQNLCSHGKKWFWVVTILATRFARPMLAPNTYVHRQYYQPNAF